ncbi:MAG: NADH-quinone oxidoreductase subunit N [Limisphaerales bacterium]|jgi:NADH-quinone oxidoreductase subunit N
MNYGLLSLEIGVVALGLGLLLLDLWTPTTQKPRLGYAAAAGLAFILLFSFTNFTGQSTGTAFHGMFIQDAMSLFFKRLFLVTAIVVLFMSVDFSNRIPTGVTEYYALQLFALAGMMTAASANNFTLLFVSVELITVTFYILVSFQRNRLVSLEAGTKYLILGALSSAFLIFGIALIFGMTGHLDFNGVASFVRQSPAEPLLQAGILLVIVGLGFKIAALPVQLWAPDVYQGAPTPTTAFLAVGSKAAGFVLLIRVLLFAIPDIAEAWHRLLIGLSAFTILYGNLCAIPQTNLKRLLGYSSIAHAGYLLLGIATLSAPGQQAVLFYLGTYLFTVLAALGVITIAFQGLDSEEIPSLAGLHQKSPFLAAALALAMVSLAGIPPLAGFFGKFLLFKAALEAGQTDPLYYTLVGVAIFGVIVSLYFYLGVVRTLYWPKNPAAPAPALPSISTPMKWALSICMVAMILLGIAPRLLLQACQLVASASSSL